MIGGDVEESLDLRSVQVHGYYPVDTRDLDDVRYKPCRNGVSGFCGAVLSAVAVVRDDRVDPACGSALHGVGHYAELHQVVVYGVGRGLDNVAVLSSYALVDVDGYLTVGELLYRGVAERFTQLLGYLGGQSLVSVASEDCVLLKISNHFFCLSITVIFYIKL